MENISLKYFDEIYKKDLLSYSLPENQRIYTALSIEELVLGVNFNNLDAYNLYLKVGFIDNGKVINGLQGLQHVLSKEIIYEP